MAGAPGIEPGPSRVTTVRVHLVCLAPFPHHPIRDVSITKLPFLQDSKWPIVREDEERVANPSYDTQIQDHLIDEILVALAEKSGAKLRSALKALIQHIKTEGMDDEM